MTDRPTLIGELLKEFRKAQRRGEFQRGRSGFPVLFSLGNGSVIPATESALRTISLLGDTMWGEYSELAESITRAEFRKVVDRGLGEILDGAHLSGKSALRKADVANRLDEYVRAALGPGFQPLEFAYGADLFGSGVNPSISIGPVRFEPRLMWLQRQAAKGVITKVTANRLERLWSGRRLQPRKPSLESALEDAIIRTARDALYMCSMETRGISSGVAESRARSAARISMAAIALLWERPAKTLEWMRLRYDGTSRSTDFVVFAENRRWGAFSGTSGLPGGIYLSEEAWSDFPRYDFLFRTVGRSLELTCDAGSQLRQPRLALAYYQALWWFEAACREATPLIAIVKFAAVLDILSDGGGRKGIVNLLKARLGFERHEPVFLDGKQMADLVDEIYESARNRAIHGDNDRLLHDWVPLCAQATAIARMCLLAAAKRVDAQPEIDDVKALLE